MNVSRVYISITILLFFPRARVCLCVRAVLYCVFVFSRSLSLCVVVVVLFACYYRLNLKWSFLYPHGNLPQIRNHNYGLRMGHVNIYHLYNKVQDVCMLLTKSPCIDLLGLSETRLNSNVSDESLPIPSYTIYWRDGAHRGQTGMGLYVHHSIVHTTKQRADLESERVECMWVEVKHSSSSATLAGYVGSGIAQWLERRTPD